MLLLVPVYEGLGGPAEAIEEDPCVGEFVVGDGVLVGVDSDVCQGESRPNMGV
jgi:hypothetical protein